MEPSASWLDLDMAGMLVANFLQSWLQASLAPQPHPQQIAHDIQDSIPPSPEDGLCLSASIDDGTGASSPGEHGQAICPQGQSPEPRLAERQDPCAGSRLRLLRHPDQQSRRFQDVGGRCFSGKSRRGLRVGSLSPVALLQRLAPDAGDLRPHRRFARRRGRLLRSSRLQRSTSARTQRNMSQAELHFIRARLQGGKRNKAQRGELRFPLPVGYVYGEEPGSVLIDPDQEVRSAVELIFELFRQTGSAYGVVRHFAQHQLRFPKRSYGGVWNGKLLWGNLKHSRVLGVLNNPSYAGAYVFGRFRSSKSLASDGQIQSKVLEQPIDSWSVLIQKHHHPYISWQEYLENQQILLHNQTNKPEQLLPNIAREGRALLQGLLLCGGCGRRLSPRYKGNGGIYPVYECTARSQDTIHQKDCIHIQANLVDQAVSQRVLAVLQPEQFQIALRALNQLQERSEAIDGQWRMRIERLDYQAQLAQRRYEQVDPSHRLLIK